LTIVQRIPPGVLGGTLVLSGSCRTGSGLLTGAAADRFRGIEEVTMIEVRPFTRGDREQLARLVNAHVAAAMPGASVPTATLLNDLERPIGEYVVGPWVTDMATLVVVEGDRIVAGAHLRRYGGEEGISESYRDAGEITWLVCWPDHLQAGRALTEAALEQLARWQVRICYGDGTLPAPGVFGGSAHETEKIVR
jgi:hypothetical protein